MNYVEFYKGLLVFGVTTGGGPPPTGALLAANNLSDVPDKPLALTNIGALPIAGGTMAGALTLAADPVSALQPVTLQYFNAHVGALTLTGAVTGSGTGSIVTSITNGAVTLGKLANLAATSVIGNSTGSSATPTAVPFSTFLLSANNLSDLTNVITARSNLSLGTAAIQDSSANTGVVASVVDPIMAGNLAIFSDNVGTINDLGIPHTNLAVLSGSTFTGTVTLAADPMLPLQAATMQYVDAKSGKLANVVLTSGTHAVAMNTNYFVDSTGGTVTLNLPSSWSVGDLLNVYGTGNIMTGYGWVIQCGAGQSVVTLGNTTSMGGQVYTPGFGTSGGPGNNVVAGVELIAQTANSVLRVRNISADGFLQTA